MSRFAILVACMSAFSWTYGGDALKYPETKRGEHMDTYHGVEIADPYRWLEDLDATETEAWVTAQNKVTFGYLASLPDRDALRARLTEVWNYERFSTPKRRGGKVFYQRNDGLQNQSVVYVQDGIEDEPRVLLDPNELSADGTTALMDLEVSHDGRLAAYSISRGGSDWREIFVRDIETAKDHADHLKWVKFSSITWDPESKGFYYSRYDEPAEGEKMEGVNRFQKLYYHRLGTPQSEDVLIYERKDKPDWGVSSELSEDKRFLIMSIWEGTRRENGVFYRDLKREGSGVVELLSSWDASYNFLGNRGETFYFQTDIAADRGKIIAIDIAKPERASWRTVIAEAPGTIDEAHMIADGFVVIYMEHALNQVVYFDIEGKRIREIELPGPGSVDGFGGEQDDRETFFSFTNYTMPDTIYRYDFAGDKATVFRKPELAIDTSSFTSKQVFFTSKDGTRVPMIISHKKGIALDGTNPTLLYGYGGFNISLTPSFNVERAVWMEQGGIFAVPNLRGGGEYGKEWHQAGTKQRKQNVFDDFIAAAEWLIENKYTSPEHLAILGGSNGGLLVGACMTQRPDLFSVALPLVGVLDMLRFHRFTIGWAWVSDYGSSEDPEGFAYLRAYSPLHNLEPGTEYPATLIMTSDHDDRVVPSHSFKFAAELQHVHQGENPVLIRIETNAGHGAGTSTTKRIEGTADRMAFTLAHTRKKKADTF